VQSYLSRDVMQLTPIEIRLRTAVTVHVAVGPVQVVSHAALTVLQTALLV